MTSPAAVLFDLDGTLVDTPRGIGITLERVTAAQAVPLDPAVVRSLIGKPLDVVLGTVLGTDDPATLASAKAEFRRIFSEIVIPEARSLLFDGMTGLLDRLVDAAAPLAVVTSKITASADELLGAAGLDHYFPVVVGHDQGVRGKPAPDLALRAADLLGCQPASCIVVGDALDDISMARAAGMLSVGVSWGVAEPGDLVAAGATETVTDPGHLAKTLTRLLHTAPAGTRLQDVR